MAMEFYLHTANGDIEEVHLGTAAPDRVFVFTTANGKTYGETVYELTHLDDAFVTNQHGERFTIDAFLDDIVEPTAKGVSTRQHALDNKRFVSHAAGGPFIRIAFDYLSGKRWESGGFDFREGEDWKYD